MYHCFENLTARGNRAELTAFVQQLNEEELVQIVHDSVCKPDATRLFDDLLQSFPDSDAHQLMRRKVIESSLKCLEKAKISVGQANAIINRIIFDLPRYSKQHLVKFVDFCIANIRQDDNELHSWKDLLPVLLETLENEKYVFHGDAEVSGTEYKLLIVTAICNSDWNINLLPSLAKMFGDIPLDKSNRDKVLQMLCSALSDLHLDQVPSFVYHALKLCKDRDNLRLLDALSKYFHHCYSKADSPVNQDPLETIGITNVKEIQDIESTVLYHVYQAVQLNHESMKDFIRFLKQVSYAPEYTLQPFMLAVLMSVYGIYEDQTFEILKLTVIGSGSEKEKRQGSAWLRQLLPPARNIIKIIGQVIDSSNKDRHLALKGLTHSAFMLMSAEQKLKSNATAMWCIGSEIVREIIKKRHETVPIVLQELINKIVAGSTPTTHYTDCLRYTCRELSIIVLDHQVWIMTLLERLFILPSTVGNQILYAILPLMHVSSNIRENLLLTLRKALYRKGISKRQVAVTGFLEMLKYSNVHSMSNYRFSQRYNTSGYTITSSSGSTVTQVTMECDSQREKPFVDCDKSLCFEILDILKKCFTYEFQVRLHLYEGLYDTVMRNVEITDHVLGMLTAHLSLYINRGDNCLPPVKFELCTDTHGIDVVSKEPIGQLIFLLQKINAFATRKNLNAFEQLRNILESLCRRMTVTELEHLNLDPESDLLVGDFPKSQLKAKHLEMAITIYEALIAFQIDEWSKANEDAVHKIDDLFKGYTRLIDFIKTQSVKVKKADSGKTKRDRDVNNTTKKPGKTHNIKVPNSIMDLDVIRQSLLLLYSQSSTSLNGTVLRRNRSFCRYILHTCEQLLQRTRSLMNDTSQMQNKRYLNAYIKVGGLLYRHFVLDMNNALVNDTQTTILALQCFKEISYCVCTLFPSELPRFLNSILRTDQDSAMVDMNQQLQEIIFSIEPHLRASIVEEGDADERKCLSFLLLRTVEQFTHKVTFESYNHDKMFECMREMIRIEDIQSPIIPGILQFFLNLEERTQAYGEALNEICLELCENVGSVDGTELVTTGQYKIIRDDTVLQIYNVLNVQIKEKLNNVSWLLMRLKAEDTIARASGTIDEVWTNNLREKERNLCKQLSQLAQVLLTLANTSVKPGSSTDVTFKNLQCLYHILGNVTKYFYAKSNAENAAFQAVKFIQVVQLAGKPLKSAFYNLVTYVEENQNKLHSKTDSYAQRNKILKETKVIPRVVYEIEQFNKEILLLGKRTGVPLENYMKRSVTRDFRIKNPQLVEGLEKMDLASSNSDYTGNEPGNRNENADDTSRSNNDDSTPSRKRARTDDSYTP